MEGLAVLAAVEASLVGAVAMAVWAASLVAGSCAGQLA